MGHVHVKKGKIPVFESMNWRKGKSSSGIRTAMFVYYRAFQAGTENDLRILRLLKEIKIGTWDIQSLRDS